MKLRARAPNSSFVVLLLAACTAESAPLGSPADGAPPPTPPTTEESPWHVESDQAYAYLGSSVARAGDVNGDGYGDILVGADGFEDGERGLGQARVYEGSAAGLSNTPTWTAEPDAAWSAYAHSVSSAGDVNGDGYDDVIVGAPFYPGLETLRGRAYLYLGGPSGPSSQADWIADGEQLGDTFGWSVAAAGDVNADGFADVIVSAVSRQNSLAVDGVDSVGRVYVYLGSSHGLPEAASWTVDAPSPNGGLGHSVAGAGDVNGDGYDDIAIGVESSAGGDAAALVYLGSEGGLSTTAAWAAERTVPLEHMDVQVRSAGDVNGDGYGDLVVGVDSDVQIPDSEWSVHDGHVDLFLGSASGLSTLPAWTLPSDNHEATVGRSIGGSGDVNHDGYSDVLVGVPYASNPELDEGQVRLFLGSPAGLSAAPSWSAEINLEAAFFGDAVANAGDVNGDLHDDVLIAARWYSGDEPDEGAVFVYLHAMDTPEDTDLVTDADTDVPDDTDGHTPNDTTTGAERPTDGCGCASRAQGVAVTPALLLLLTAATRRRTGKVRG